jgi:hypothetical protein
MELSKGLHYQVPGLPLTRTDLARHRGCGMKQGRSGFVRAGPYRLNGTVRLRATREVQIGSAGIRPFHFRGARGGSNAEISVIALGVLKPNCASGARKKNRRRRRPDNRLQGMRGRSCFSRRQACAPAPYP